MKGQVLLGFVTLLALAASSGHAQRVSPAYVSVRPEFSATQFPTTNHVWDGDRSVAPMERSWKSHALIGALVGVAAAATIATGPMILCGSFGDRSQCPSFWLTTAKVSTITIPFCVLMSVAGYFPDRWPVERAPRE